MVWKSLEINMAMIELLLVFVSSISTDQFTNIPVLMNTHEYPAFILILFQVLVSEK